MQQPSLKGRCVLHYFLATLLLFLAMCSTCTFASPDTGSLTLSDADIAKLRRDMFEGLAKTPAMPVARAPGAMDEPNPACLAPINITFPIAYTYGPFSNSGTCAGDEPCVFAFFTAGPSGASGQGAAVNVLADPYHIEVFSVNESVVVTLNTAQFDPATVTCVTTASTYPLEPSIVQSSTSIVITAGSSTTTATAGITCFLKELPNPAKPCCLASGQTKSQGTLCRNTTSLCMLEAACLGNSGECPDNPPAARGVVCRKSTSPCTLRTVCNGNSTQCPPNPTRPDDTPCPWHPRRQGHPYYEDASTLKRSAATDEEATALLMMAAKPAYGWPQCEGKCHDGVCALRWDHPACCAVPTHYGGYGHYSSAAAEQHTESVTAGVSGGRWRDEGLYCWN